MGRDRTPSSLLSSTARGASWLAAPGLTRYSVPSNHPTSFFLRKQIGLSTTRTVQDESVVYELRYPCPELSRILFPLETPGAQPSSSPAESFGGCPPSLPGSTR